jgi:hypothetical protein
MNDDIKNTQDKMPCVSCKHNPCVCSDKDTPPVAPEKKPRVKGSHRNGSAPKTKWL